MKAKMRKIAAFCLIASLLFTIGAPAAADGPVIITLESATADAGERAEIIVSVSNNPGVSGGAFTVSWNSEDIRLVDIQPIAKGSFAKNISAAGFSWLKGSNVEGSFQLAKLIFETDAEAFGQYEINIGLKDGNPGNLTNENSVEVDCAFSGGILTLRRPSDAGAPSGGAPSGGGEEEKPDDGNPLEQFDDLKEGTWYSEAVEYVVSEGIMKGVDEMSFAPSMPTSRAMIVTMLYRLSGEPKVTGGEEFVDVSTGKWYSDAVAWASAKGIIEGYGEGIFGPNYLVTREQLAVIFQRWARSMGMDTSQSMELDSYHDADEIQFWAVDAMEWACAIGLMEGRSPVSLSPGGSSMRSEAAMLLWRWNNICA